MSILACYHKDMETQHSTNQWAMTATPAKTTPEKKNNFSFALLRDYFNSFKFYPLGTKLLGVAFRLRKKKKNLLSCTRVLHRTLNLVISRCCFAKDGRRNVPKFKTHVQVDCFCSLNLLFCGIVVAVAVLVA